MVTLDVFLAWRYRNTRFQEGWHLDGRASVVDQKYMSQLEVARINTQMIAVNFCIAASIVGRVQKGVVMPLTNEWKYNTLVLDPKTVIW